MHQVYSNNLEKEEQMALVYMQNQKQKDTNIKNEKKSFLKNFKNIKFLEYISSFKQYKNVLYHFEKSNIILVTNTTKGFLIAIGTVLKLENNFYNPLRFIGIYNLETGLLFSKEGNFLYKNNFGEKFFNIPLVARLLIGFSFFKIIIKNKEINLGLRKYTVYNTGILDYRHFQQSKEKTYPIGYGDMYNLYTSLKLQNFKILCGISVLTEMNFLHALIHLFTKKINFNCICSKSFFLEINFSFFE